MPWLGVKRLERARLDGTYNKTICTAPASIWHADLHERGIVYIQGHIAKGLEPTECYSNRPTVRICKQAVVADEYGVQDGFDGH